MNVVGPGMGNLTVTESVADRVLTETGANPVTVSGMTITGGHPVSDTVLGGCVFNDGTLTLSGVRVTGCTATATGPAMGLPSTDAEGAAIGSIGTLTLSGSLVDGNQATATGTTAANIVTARGAVNAQGAGSLTIDNSTITNNDRDQHQHLHRRNPSLCRGRCVRRRLELQHLSQHHQQQHGDGHPSTGHREFVHGGRPLPVRHRGWQQDDRAEHDRGQQGRPRPGPGYSR